jgi:hypothetical protein
MEILRVPPYSPSVTLGASSPATEYVVRIQDMVDHSVSETSITSDSSSKVFVDLPGRYDNQYLIFVDDQEVFVEVVRPYVNPALKATTASEIAEYAKHEELARAIIDSVVAEGFYYRKELIQTTGLGADYLPLWTRAQKLLRLHENNIKVFDVDEPTDSEFAYGLSEDKTAITIIYNDGINKAEGAPNLIPLAPSDMTDIVFGYRGFPKTFDYVAVLESGYQEVPSDVVRATELLIEDIACGRLDHYKRYIAEYNTDQFKIKFDKSIFEGTGNILVDKILSKYVKSIRKVGVL